MEYSEAKMAASYIAGVRVAAYGLCLKSELTVSSFRLFRATTQPTTPPKLHAPYSMLLYVKGRYPFCS